MSGARGPYQSAEERRDRIAELTRQGLSVALVAEMVGVATRTVERARAVRGCARPQQPRITADELATAKALLDDGASYSEAARTIGRSVPGLIRRLPGYGWDKQRGGQYSVLMRALSRLERQAS